MVSVEAPKRGLAPKGRDACTQKLLLTFCSGPLVRIGPTDVLTGDAEAYRRIHAVRSPYTRSDWYIGTRVDPPNVNVFNGLDDEEHTELRTILSPEVRISMSMLICL